MKKIFLVLAIILVVPFCSAQKDSSSEYSYSLSTPFNFFLADKEYSYTKGSESVVLKFESINVLVQKFNNQKPSFIKSVMHDNFFPKNYRIESVLEVGNKFFVFYSSWNGETDKEQLFAVELDFEKGSLSKNHKPILVIDGKIEGKSSFSFIGGSVSGMIAGTQDKFDFMLSHDKSKMLVQYIKKAEVKNDKKNFNLIGLITFDENLNEISNREIKMPHTERRLANLDNQIDSEGNLYLLNKVFHDDSKNDKKKNSDLEANYHLELFFIKNNSNEIKISKFENRNKFIIELKLLDSPKDFIVCGGLYSNGKGDLDDSDGVLAFKIDKTGKIYDEVTYGIPLSVLNQNESEKTIKKNGKYEQNGEGAKFTDLKLKDLVINEDGSFIVVGEQYFAEGHGSSGLTKYNYNNILVTKIGVTGDLKWMRKIPKYQVGYSGDIGLSYKYISVNNNHYFVFLDNIKNMNLLLNDETNLYIKDKGGCFSAVKILDFDGSMTKTSVFNDKEVKDFQMQHISANNIIKMIDNSFMFEAFKSSKKIMIKVIFK